MKRILIILAIAALSCSKEYSAHQSCGKIMNKIHEGQPAWTEQPPRNEIWAIAVSVTDTTERWVGVDSTTFNRLNIGDKWCD